MTFLAKFLFVASSWFPIYVLIGILELADHTVLAYWLIGAGVASVIAIWAVKEVVSTRFAPETFILVSAAERNDDVFMYIISYLPPFFALDLSTGPKVWALVCLYLFIFLTYVRLGQYHLNPIFVFFGYRVFDVDVGRPKALHVIAKRDQPLSAGQEVRLVVYDDLALIV